MNGCQHYLPSGRQEVHRFFYQAGKCNYGLSWRIATLLVHVGVGCQVSEDNSILNLLHLLQSILAPQKTSLEETEMFNKSMHMAPTLLETTNLLKTHQETHLRVEVKGISSSGITMLSLPSGIQFWIT